MFSNFQPSLSLEELQWEIDDLTLGFVRIVIVLLIVSNWQIIQIILFPSCPQG